MSNPTALENQLADVMAAVQSPEQILDSSLEAPIAPEIPTLPTFDTPEGNAPVVPQPQPTDGILPQASPENQPQVPDNKYNMMHGRLRVANQRIKELEAMQATGQAPLTPDATSQQPQGTRTPDQVSDDEVRSRISSEQIDEWGMDYWKQIIAIQAPAVPQQAGNEQVHQLQQRVYNSELMQLVPNYAQVDASPQFQAWLQSVEPVSQVAYGTWLKDAEDYGDALQAARIYEMFLTSGAATTPVSNPQPSTQQFQTPVMPAQMAAPIPGQTPQMSLAQFDSEMKKLTTEGLSPLEMADRQKELTAKWKAGQVNTQQPMQSAPSFI